MATHAHLKALAQTSDSIQAGVSFLKLFVLSETETKEVP